MLLQSEVSVLLGLSGSVW